MQHDFALRDFLYLVRGAEWTLALSLIAFAGGGLCGLWVALGRRARNGVVRRLTVAFIRANQGTPLLIQLFIFFFGAAMLGADISPLAAASGCLILNTGAFLGDIWAGCIAAIPLGQWQAAEALGLRRYARYRHVVLPQAVRIAVAPTVGILVHVIKGTSLASLIGFVELSRAGQVVNNATYAPMLVFASIGGLYFALCWPLSRASAWLERRLSHHA